MQQNGPVTSSTGCEHIGGGGGCGGCPASADRDYIQTVQRNDDGSVILTRSEAQLVRSALFTIEHYLNNVWDETEVSAVSGHQIASFRTALREIDDLRAPDEFDDRQEDLRVAIARFENLTNEQLTTGRPARWLKGIVAAARAHDVPVSERLSKLGQHAQRGATQP